jgi:hypothetical protein
MRFVADYPQLPNFNIIFLTMTKIYCNIIRLILIYFVRAKVRAI